MFSSVLLSIQRFCEIILRIRVVSLFIVIVFHRKLFPLVFKLQHTTDHERTAISVNKFLLVRFNSGNCDCPM